MLVDAAFGPDSRPPSLMCCQRLSYELWARGRVSSWRPTFINVGIRESAFHIKHTAYVLRIKQFVSVVLNKEDVY